MTKNQFLSELKRKLRALPKEERDNAIEFYENYFNDAANEEEALKKLGDVNEIAANLILEFGEKKPNKKSGVSWITVLFAILSAPITLPLGFAGILLLGAGILTGGLFLFSLFLLFVGFLMAGLVSVFAIIPGFILNFPTGCFFLGMFLLSVSIAYFSLKFVVTLAKKFAMLINDAIKKLIHKKYKV